MRVARQEGMILLMGPPGSGRAVLAKALPSILPPRRKGTHPGGYGPFGRGRAIGAIRGREAVSLRIIPQAWRVWSAGTPVR
ncbi:MAG: ATP-binding protein [Eggerthellaceae bacterium]